MGFIELSMVAVRVLAKIWYSIKAGHDWTSVGGRRYDLLRFIDPVLSLFKLVLKLGNNYIMTSAGA